MKLEPNVNGSSLVVTPLKISSTLVGQQKLSKVEPIPIETTKTDNEEDFDQFPDEAEIEVDEELDETSSCVKNENGSEFSVEATKAAIIKVEAIDNETCETEESAVGKKKSVRKKRSLNWEEAERSLLVEIIKPKVDFVENKSVDAKSIKSKRMAWLHVTKQFNSLNFRHRSLEQIQVQWRSMKNSAKKEYQQKNPKSTILLEGIHMLEFMEEMQKEPIIGGTRSQTRNSTIQIKKELPDDLDEEDDTPLAALPATLLNSTSNSEDTQPTSTLAMSSSPTTLAESQNMDFQQISEPINDVQVKKRKSVPKLKQKTTKPKTTQQENKSPGDNSVPGIGLKIKRQKCEANTTTSSSSLTDVSSTGVSLSSTSTNLNTNYITSATKPPAPTTITLTTSTLTTPPPSPPICLDEKYKKQLFDLIKRARLADIDYARKEHEQKIRFEQQEQDLKVRYMRELHEQRMRFAMMEHEARMRVYTLTSKPTPTTSLPAATQDI